MGKLAGRHGPDTVGKLELWRYPPSWLVTSITALIKVNGAIKGCGGADKLQRCLAGARKALGIHGDSLASGN